MGKSDSDMGMTMEELSEIYRVEKKTGSITDVRPDLYSAMARFLKELKSNYENLLRTDPDSIVCDGLNARRKKSQQTSRDIIKMRMDKICKMALRAAMGESHSLDNLTDEEKTYYEAILKPSKFHNGILDRLSGNMQYVVKDVTEEAIPVPPVQPIISKTVVEPPAEEEPVEEYYEPEDDIPVAPEKEPIPVPVPAAQVMENEVDLDIIPEGGEFEMDIEPEMEIPEDELDKMMPPEEDVVAPMPVVADDTEYLLIHILEDLPTFSGPTRDYNLKKEQVVRMPTDIAQALINRNFARKISYSP